MHIHDAFTFVAIFWLFYRLARFLSIPVSSITKTLNIEIPSVTKLSIDRISFNSITVRWENEPLRQNTKCSIDHYILYLNGKKVGMFSNNTCSLYTSCCLMNLKPYMQYQLDFITVNKNGFISKLPPLYVMTKSQNRSSNLSNKSNNGNLTIISGDLFGDISNMSLQDAKWRKQPTSVSDEPPTSYASLTTLKSLEHFSIEDLKKILIYAQEDLHDVLQQQSAVLQDFHETEIQLNFELDTLKNQLFHEIDLKKSLKSSIKSLENSKLLYDLKKDKLEKSISNVRSTIEMMKLDTNKWETEQQSLFKHQELKKIYQLKQENLIKRINEVSSDVKTLQQEISEREEENKKLNHIKKSLENVSVYTGNTSNHTSTNSHQQKATTLTNDIPSWNTILNKINEYTIEKSGILSIEGEEFLTTLPANSLIASLIKEELDKDLASEYEWRISKAKLKKRIDQLEKIWHEINLENRQLRSSLTAKPYSGQVQPLSNSESDSLNIGASSYIDIPHTQTLSQSMNHTYSSNSSISHPSYNCWTKQLDSQNVLTQQYNEDQTFEYDDSNHLLSGLHTMISEVDSQDKSISASKAFTNDQLDNYWNNSETFLGLKPEKLVSSSESFSSPPLTPSQLSHQSFNKTSQNFFTVLNDTQAVGLDLLHATHSSPSIELSTNNDDIPLRSSISATSAIIRNPDPMRQNGGFHSPNFNDIWNIQPKPSKDHAKSVSWSSWGPRHSTNNSPMIPPTPQLPVNISKMDPIKNDKGMPNTRRRMSKLLSKSSMNHLFKSQIHENRFSKK